MVSLAAWLGVDPATLPELAPRRGPRIGRPPGNPSPPLEALAGEASEAPLPGIPVTHVRGVLAERVVISTELDPYMPLSAVAKYSGLSKRKIEQFIALPPDEALPCYRLPGGTRPGKVLVRRSEFDAWIAQYRSRGRPSLARAIREMGLAA